MEKREIIIALLECVEQILSYLEENSDYDALYGDGLYSMLYIRYQNARSALREPNPGYSRLQKSLQFLISANRAYIGDSGNWEDPLRELLSRSDKLVDSFLRDDEANK